MHRTEGANNVAGLYSAGPPPTTITADALNSIQEEICNVIEYSGQAIKTAATDTRNQLLAALLALIPTYDAIVVSQASWDAIIERTAANTYQFKGDYKSVFVKVGDYTLTLSGGDTWGQLQTNNVMHLEFERGAAITFGNTSGYLNINTSNCYLKNVIVKGLETVASAVQYSFLISNFGVTLDNCIATRRLSNTNMTGFQGSATAEHNWSTKYINCRAGLLTSSGNISGFYLCQNMFGCSVSVCTCTGTGVLYGFSTCDNISSSHVYTLDSYNGAIIAFYNCTRMSSCYINDLDISGSGQLYGISGCSSVSSCMVRDLSGVSVSAFENCVNISSCSATQIDGSGAGNVYGFTGCSNIAACSVNDIDSVNGNAFGFYSCNRISSCYANDVDSSGGTANGFNTCTYGAALNTDEAANAGNDYMDTTDAAITNKFSTMATAWT